MLGLVARMISRTPPARTRSTSGRDFELLRADALDGRERPVQHVVAPR